VFGHHPNTFQYVPRTKLRAEACLVSEHNLSRMIKSTGVRIPVKIGARRQISLHDA
jgi:hypothetical protein